MRPLCQITAKKSYVLSICAAVFTAAPTEPCVDDLTTVETKISLEPKVEGAVGGGHTILGRCRAVDDGVINSLAVSARETHRVDRDIGVIWSADNTHRPTRDRDSAIEDQGKHARQGTGLGK
jgi:hypothetical protein